MIKHHSNNEQTLVKAGLNWPTLLQAIFHKAEFSQGERHFVLFKDQLAESVGVERQNKISFLAENKRPLLNTIVSVLN